MNRCKLCVIPDTRPDTGFELGVCSGCHAFAARASIDWHQRLEQLKDLLAKARTTAAGRGTQYDCIVPSSGGKDSHAQVLTLLALGARPLVVTASTCHLTPMGRRNISNLARHATTIEVTANRVVRAKLNRLGLELVGDISWPEHASIFTVPFRMAARLGIPLVFYGESPQNQYGGPPGSAEERRMTSRWVHEFGGFLGLRASDFVGKLGITEADMLEYQLPPEEEIEGVEAYFLGQFMPWDSHANAAQAEKGGFTYAKPGPANYWKHENLDNAQTGLHDHIMYRKYGYGRGCAQLAVDVRTGRVTREEAMDWIRTTDGWFPYVYADISIYDVISPLGLNLKSLDPILAKFTNQALFEGEASRHPKLKQE